MAYGVKYRFKFESVDGVEWTIDVLKDGYSGSILNRAMGGAPCLRKDMDGCIQGTSLDFIAECAVDGEFQEFSTSDPFAFQVKLYHGLSLVWQGYVTPEIYRAPEIAPPYDVNITATDGLGELKQHTYTAQGSRTLSYLFSYLLDFTGLSFNVQMVWDLCIHGETPDWGSNEKINLDYMAGKTLYDVLQALLTSIHARITQTKSAWYVIKETGLPVDTSTGEITFPGSGGSFAVEFPSFGQMSTHPGGFWPVGHMIREYIAPKRKIVLTSANHYRSDLLAGTWSLDGSATDEGDYYSLPQMGSQMSTYISFIQEVRKHLMLSIKVRNVGDGSTAGTLVVYVGLTGHSYGGTSFYLVNGTSNRRQESMDVTWSPSSGTCSFEVQAPMESDTDQDYVTIDVLLPLYNNSARYYMGAEALSIAIVNGDSLYPKRIYDVQLYQYEQTAGFRKIVNIDNGARGDAPDVDLAVACLKGANAYNGIEQLQYGVLTDTDDQKILKWDTEAFSNMDFFDLMARDYAMSHAAPRVRMSGKLNTDPDWATLPVMFTDDHDGVPYLVETFSWDLYNDEIDVQMISLPASTLTVDDEALEEGVTDNTTNHVQAAPSSGGGGGGGSTVAISNLLSTGSRIATVTIDGVSKDIKSSVVALSNLLNSGDRVATLTLDGTAYDIKSPQYSLVSIRDRLTTGTKIATIQIGLSAYDLYAPGGSVGISDLISNGFLIGVLTIGTTSYNIKIPVPDISIGGTDAAPTVVVAVGSGNSGSVALPVATATKAGIVSTGAQTFGGYKTFSRIYLGNSEARGAYLEWDDTRRAWKLVGDVYATGDVAAGG